MVRVLVAVEALEDPLTDVVRQSAAVLGTPWMPRTSGRILDALGVPEGGWVDGEVTAELAAPLGAPRPLGVLFEKVTAEEVAAWKARFGGPD